nr:hypothetical protein [uncultured Acinetobacter sp.]
MTSSDDENKTEFISSVKNFKSILNRLNRDFLKGRNISNKVAVETALKIKEEISGFLDEIIVPYYLDPDYGKLRRSYIAGKKSIKSVLNQLSFTLESTLNDLIPEDIPRLHLIERALIDEFEAFKIAISYIEKMDDSINVLNDKINEKISSSFDSVNRAVLAYENDKIASVYKAVFNELESKANFFERLFWGAIVSGAFLALLSMLAFTDVKEGNFWFSKILIVAITVTFSTYFVRRSAHLRKQSDQLKRESWEMDALPVFIASLDKPLRDEVIKDLVPKYFGNGVDQSINDKLSDLVSEQLKTSLETLKTSTEIIKSARNNPQG